MHGSNRERIGPLHFHLHASHGIADSATNAFAGGSWNVTRAATAGALVINEFLAANASIAPADENAEFSDWIEIFNPTGNPAVNLVGWSLSTDADTPKLHFHAIPGEEPQLLGHDQWRAIAEWHKTEAERPGFAVSVFTQEWVKHAFRQEGHAFCMPPG